MTNALLEFAKLLGPDVYDQALMIVALAEPDETDRVVGSLVDLILED